MELDSGEGSGGRRSRRGLGDAGRWGGVETDGKGVRLRIRGPRGADRDLMQLERLEKD